MVNIYMLLEWMKLKNNLLTSTSPHFILFATPILKNYGKSPPTPYN